ncbi:MAG: cation-translocating P-type ATPase [Synechococcaceae cyanobacterium SM2_3_1]|nr:cation-translocating P-type ATPase [Synechococcaceae cyanobacterium SM2_3_1]
MTSWYNISSAETLQSLQTALSGLSQAEVETRLQHWGPNQLPDPESETLWQLLLKQILSSLVLILLAAAVLSLWLGDYKDALAILAIVGFNSVIGVRQEVQANQAMAALNRLTIPQVWIRRDGLLGCDSARALVPGDVVVLEAGHRVPADCRLLETHHLQIQESSLTGESEPVEKTEKVLNCSDIALADQSNMAFMGTLVTSGRGVAVVTETGLHTHLGQIATAIQAIQTSTTPLQKRLDQLGWVLGIGIVIICGLVFLLGLLRGEDWMLMALESVSLAVAAVPEGLPAVVTIALALGCERMLGQQVLIRNLPAVETLGSVTVICTDKTGTLTEGRMTVAEVITASGSRDLRRSLETSPPELHLLFLGAILCNNAPILQFTSSTPATPLGDPTEVALMEAGIVLQLHRSALEAQFPRVAEIPFDVELKRMITIHNLPDLQYFCEDLQPWQTDLEEQGIQRVAFLKGAPETLLKTSTYLWQRNERIPLLDRDRLVWQQRVEDLAAQGRRLIGVAYLPLAADALAVTPADQCQQVFLGIVGLYDAPRPEAARAVQNCQKAGMRTLLITGDHPLTAETIARETGISDGSGPGLTGHNIDEATPEQLGQWVQSRSVFSRVTPQHKLQVVRSLQQQGEVVAMTGDGINDAPALKQADIGIAMGRTGTDVAKEAADMVLLDDNFSAIVAATHEGRRIYDNVRKFIRFSLTGNFGELWLIILGPFLGLPLPLLPLQILWINLLADGILAVALSFEPAEPSVMQRPPYAPQESVFSRGLGWGIGWIGALMGGLLLLIAWSSWQQGNPHWRSIVFTALLACRVGLVLTMRSERTLWLQLPPNPVLLLAVSSTCILHLLILYIPWLQPVFQCDGLLNGELWLCLGAGISMMICGEGEKAVRRLLQPSVVSTQGSNDQVSEFGSTSETP